MPANFCCRLLLMFSVITYVSCGNKTQTSSNLYKMSEALAPQKFEPADGQVILFTGQELESVGGTEKYNDGYYDHFPPPGGFTQYTSFQGKGLTGLTTLDNWGDGPENMSIPINDPDFKNSCLAIGLDISQGHDSITATGAHDTLIFRLGKWISSLGNRPVFLRIGYEFDGFAWNHYKQDAYVAAFRRIRSKLDSMGVNNIAYVWQSKGAGAERETMDLFYPGDDYVDWVGYSYFIPSDSSHPMIQFARDHHKPLFIAESSTVFLDSKGVCKPLDLTRQADVELAWRDWFLPYFRTIRRYPDVIKAVHYINAPWKYRPLWKNNPYFKNIDARITKNDSLKKWWLLETNQPMYLKASDTLFSYLNMKSQP